MITPALERCLHKRIETVITKTSEMGLLEKDGKSPRVEAFEEQIQPYLRSPQTQRPIDLEILVRFAQIAGPAFEFTRDRTTALRWYQVGQYDWLGRRHFIEYLEVPSLEIEWSVREAPALPQLNSALMAALLGNISKATDLFTWAADNFQLTAEEKAYHEKSGYYQSIWQSIGFRIGCRIWLGRWEEARSDAVLSKRNIGKTRRAGYPRDFREPQLLASIGADLSDYFLDPTEGNCQRARDALIISKIPDRDPDTRASMIPYLLAYRKQYGEAIENR